MRAHASAALRSEGIYVRSYRLHGIQRERIAIALIGMQDAHTVDEVQAATEPPLQIPVPPMAMDV